MEALQEGTTLFPFFLMEVTRIWLKVMGVFVEHIVLGLGFVHRHEFILAKNSVPRVGDILVFAGGRQGVVHERWRLGRSETVFAVRLKGVRNVEVTRPGFFFLGKLTHLLGEPCDLAHDVLLKIFGSFLTDDLLSEFAESWESLLQELVFTIDILFSDSLELVHSLLRDPLKVDLVLGAEMILVLQHFGGNKRLYIELDLVADLPRYILLLLEIFSWCILSIGTGSTDML